MESGSKPIEVSGKTPMYFTGHWSLEGGGKQFDYYLPTLIILIIASSVVYYFKSQQGH